MNRLNKMLLSFVLSIFCLLISVSNGAFSTTPLGANTSSSNGGSRYSASSLGSSGYNTFQVKEIVYNYYLDTSNSANSVAFTDMVTALHSSGYGITIVKQQANPAWQYAYVYNYIDVDIGFLDTIKSPAATLQNSEYNDNLLLKLECNPSTSETYYYDILSISYFRTLYQTDGELSSILYSTNPIKLLTRSGSGWIWDGTSYYYESPLPEEPDTPSLPSNAEIASAVQAFYNSDYYKNNTEFDDFFVLYNYDNQYFSFIGHSYEDKFQQLIFPAGHKYNQQWWKFGLDGLTTELSSYIFNKYYWLYSTNDFGENFSYDGKGLLSDLLNLNFSTSSTIVYSTNEYDVVVYSYNENNELTNEMDTMPGDQYTYDENLDPTTNEYNPLENFVPTNPSQSILGDVNFDEINKVFEENKNILDIENASWLFTANNQLINYFVGFISFLIVLIIISRLLGG